MSFLNNPTLRNLWIANTVSNFGTMFGALSLTALIYLHASPSQMGLLVASASIPVLLLALMAGVWVDRLPRVPVMVFADLGRFVALLTMPAAALLDVLRIEQLYAVSFVSASLRVTFDVAFRSVLLTVVEREALASANGMLKPTSLRRRLLVRPSKGASRKLPAARWSSLSTRSHSSCRLSSCGAYPRPGPSGRTNARSLARRLKDGARLYTSRSSVPSLQWS